MTDVTIGPVAVDDVQFADLVRRHLEHARSTTPPENVFALDLSDLSGPAIQVFGMWRDGSLIGMGRCRTRETRRGRSNPCILPRRHGAEAMPA